MPHPHNQYETEMFQKNVKLPIGKIGAVAGALTACVILWGLLVPSKAKVDELNNRIATLEASTKQDHDALTELKGDVRYIRGWVEQQQGKRQP